MAIESTARPSPVQSRKVFRTGQVLTLSGAHLIHDVYGAFLAPLLPLLIEKLSLSLAMAGSLTMFLRLPSLINPFIGMLADRVDMRLFVVLTPSVTAVSMSLLGLAPSYIVLAILLVVAGLSSAAFHVPGPVLVTRVAGGQTGKGMSYWMTAGELARALGPLLAVAAVTSLTLEGMWPVMILGIGASAVIYRRVKDIELPPPPKNQSSLVQTWRSMRHVFQPLAGIVLARGFMAGSLTVFLPTFFKAEGQTLWFAGMALALLEFSGAAGALMSGTLSDRFGRRSLLLVALSSAPFFMLAFLVVEGWLKLPLLVLMGLAIFSTMPVMMAMVQDHAGEQPATANGIYMMINFVIGATIPMLIGLLADRVGLQTAFACSAIFALTAVPLIFLLPTDK